MAWIGSDGSEGKEGKEDCSALLGLRAIGADTVVFPRPLPFERKFVRIELSPTGQPLDARAQAGSDKYWERAKLFGLVDSVISSDDGKTILILNAQDAAEARRLVDGDDLVQGGIFQVDGVREL